MSTPIHQVWEMLQRNIEADRTTDKSLPPSAVVNLDPPHTTMAFQLGAREMQVHLLREALVRYGKHADYCHVSWRRCTCGLAEALTTGADLATIADVLRRPEVK